jgi:methyl-accepting chemotaxis protein
LLRRLRNSLGLQGFTLGFKISLYLVLVLVSLGVVISFVVARQHARVMEAEFASRGYAIALSLANTAPETLLFHDASSIQSFIDGFRSMEGVAYIYLAAPDQRLIAHTFVPGFPSTLRKSNPVPPGKPSSTLRVTVPDRGEFLDIGVPVLYGVMGEVHVGMDLRLVDRAVRGMILSVGWRFGVAIVLGLVVLIVLIHRLLRPIQELMAAAVRVGQGDLQAGTTVAGRDELAHLSRSFNTMVDHLRQAIHRVTDSRRAMEESNRQLAEVAEKVMGGVRMERGCVSGTEERVGELLTLSNDIRYSLELLRQTAHQTRQSSTQITGSVQSIDQGTKKLFTAVDGTGETLVLLDTAIQEVTGTVESLREVASASATSAEALEVSVRGVEHQTREVARVTQELEGKFRTGIAAVQKAVRSSEGIGESSARTTALIRRLLESMESIADILRLINDINDKTSLLALNAAIIAAQAGRRGHGFSVVAGEMKKLSERTEASTKEIGSAIAGIRDEARETLRALAETDARVGESVALSRQAGEVIVTIQTGVEEVNHRVAEIARAAKEQSSTGGALSASVQELHQAIQRLASAALEQASSSTELVQESRAMRGIADLVAAMAANQSAAAKGIDQQVAEVAQVLSLVSTATESQSVAVQSVGEAMTTLSGISEENAAMVDELGDVISRLRETSERLRHEMARFSL